MRIKRIQAPIIAGLLLLMLILPQWALADGPQISNVVVLDRTYTTATITWTTNTSSDSAVHYGNTTLLGDSVYDSSMVTTHFMGLPGLTPDTTYYFAVVSTDASGTCVDNNSGAYYQFTTLPLPATVYNITLNPICGACGEMAQIGNEWLCNELIGVTAIVGTVGTYHISWDSPTNSRATFTAGVPGVYETEFYLPEATKGIHNVYLVDNAYTTRASTTFEVSPSVKISPTEGPVGTTVTLNGYGFTASQQLQIKFKDTVIATPTANTVGSWNVSYTIPATPAGGYVFEVDARDGTTGWVNWVNKYFKVTPKITVSSSSGTVGQTVAINGTGFASNEKDIKVTFGGKMVKQISYANGNGSWSDTIAVPPVQRGDYEIDASGTSTRARDVPDVTFTVNAGILVEPISAYIGDTITVAGGGFAIGETGIQVYFDGLVVSPSTITANTSGCWQSSFTLPVSTYGSHTVSASGDITQPAVTRNISTRAEILAISPAEGAPSDSVSLTGNGFHGSQKLTVTIGGVAAPIDAPNTTQPNGNVVISFHVPKGSTEGQRTLVVADEGGATSSVNFTVTKKTLSIIPLPILPKNSTLRSGGVTFQWQGVAGSTGYTYTLEISGEGGTWSKSGITGSSYTLTDTKTDTETVRETLDRGTYYWRVKVVDDYGNEGNWSDSTKFTVSPIPTWVWVVVGLVVLVVLMVVAYRETRFKVTE